jgi:hypothetical protein
MRLLLTWIVHSLMCLHKLSSACSSASDLLLYCIRKETVFQVVHSSQDYRAVRPFHCWMLIKTAVGWCYRLVTHILIWSFWEQRSMRLWCKIIHNVYKKFHNL